MLNVEFPQRRVSSLPSSRAAGDKFYFAFNDDPPAEVSSSYYAHAKSVVAFNEAGGYDDNSCFERDDCWIVLEAATVSE